MMINPLKGTVHYFFFVAPMPLVGLEMVWDAFLAPRLGQTVPKISLSLKVQNVSTVSLSSRLFVFHVKFWKLLGCIKAQDSGKGNTRWSPVTSGWRPPKIETGLLVMKNKQQSFWLLQIKNMQTLNIHFIEHSNLIPRICFVSKWWFDCDTKI